MDDEAQARQVDAAGGDVRRDADSGAAVAKRLQGGVAVALAKFTRQRNHGESALGEAGLKMTHGVPGVAEHHRGGSVGLAQEVEHNMLGLPRHDPHRPVGDIRMPLVSLLIARRRASRW